MKKVFSFFLSFIFIITAFAQQQRALLVGIDQYKPPPGYSAINTDGRTDYPNLSGCKNDAAAIYSIITSRFGFRPGNIDTLFDHSATRDGILNAMKKLLGESNAGDMAFIYYAGHGSEVKNSLSFELDKKDQTIVPADTWKEGVKDIRDKELSKIFNGFLDKKVKLTVIFDCCHSGSLSRGPNIITDKARYMPMADWDSKDASKPLIPEKREGNDFLIFSAAQSDERAAEQTDDNGMRHGAFTLALIQSLNQQSVDASALTIFTSARAILKSNGKSQEPVIGGSTIRQQETLFGIKKGKLSDFSLVAVSGIIKNKVQLQAGFALGLAKENELAMFNEKQDTVFKLRIDTILGVTKSLATVIKGDIKEIKPGYQFRVVNWVSSGRPLIKLFIPVSGLPDAADVFKYSAIANELKKSPLVKWVPFIGRGESAPYTSVFWINNKCFIKNGKGLPVELKNITTQNILKLCSKDSTLYMELPVSKENAIACYKMLSQNKSLQLVDSINTSAYTLFGRLGVHGLPAYGFRKTQVAVSDSLESMPVETDCFEIPALSEKDNRNIADSLFGMALKLSKLRGWLNLSGPDINQKNFSYRLEIYNEDKRQPITDGHYRIGDKLSLKLVANEDYPKSMGAPKYVYVFAVDQSGSMQLYFPGDDGNVENKFPRFEINSIIKEVTIISYTVPAPSGTDNFFLLASDEPIPDASAALNQEGVYSGITSRGLPGRDNPLSGLLDMGNAGSRGLPKKLPATWSIQKFTFRCTY
ncbi:MAG: hypothetical protein B6D37_01555 [Sphingobacteriales bacterium UTBCD1]|jgi:hypothetical protein|nr:MAG: hypothetical protein B6D37_01555 [Sphingobacteriales bacterium UTBCD1]